MFIKDDPGFKTWDGGVGRAENQFKDYSLVQKPTLIEACIKGSVIPEDREFDPERTSWRRQYLPKVEG